MKTNYQLLLDGELARAAGSRGSLLLHSCCAPCSSYVLEYLTKYFNITVYYYNPNIYPREEYDKRLAEQRRLISLAAPEAALVAGEYDDGAFYERVRGLEGCPEGGARCAECFKLRLGEAARYAAENGFDWFTTTLTVSPHKNSALLNELGEAAGALYGVKFLPSDFKKRDGYKRSIELSGKYGLYRQNYCGCKFSLRQG